MGIRTAKTTAVIFIVLFLGYYQRWLYVPIIEAISGRLSIDTGAPELIEEFIKINVDANDSSRSKNKKVNEAGGKGRLISGIGNNVHKVDPELELEATKLSQLIQRQLEVTQRGQNLNLIARGCNLPKLICGAPIDCGLGCQLHHITTCLMVAYSTNRTLILHWDNWPYIEMSWSDIFLPIGLTDCPIDNDTATVLWTRTGIDISYPEMKTYPYKSGLPISYEVGDSLKKLPTNSLLWWTGQFAKFTMRFQLSEEELMKKLKTAMKFYLPTVGLLMRKRDKLSEKKIKSSPQSIDKYMTYARKYFSRLEELIPTVTRRVYIATDDRNIIKLVRKRYRPPKWEILGIQLKTDVEDLLKDIYLLSECDYVICNFSTDICRLVLELKESSTLNSADRVKSLDLKYLNAVPGFKKIQFLQQII